MCIIYTYKYFSITVNPLEPCAPTTKVYSIPVILGENVDYMYREEPNSDTDSGWRFLSNTEDEEYLDNPENTDIYSVNAVAHNDKAIIPYLKLPVGSELARIEGTDEFEVLD